MLIVFWLSETCVESLDPTTVPVPTEEWGLSQETVERQVLAAPGLQPVVVLAEVVLLREEQLVWPEVRQQQVEE